MTSDDRYENLFQGFFYYLGVLSFIVIFKYRNLHVPFLPITLLAFLFLFFDKPIAIYLGATPTDLKNPKPLIKNEIDFSTFVFRACLFWVFINIVYLLGIELYFRIILNFGGVGSSIIFLLPMLLYYLYYKISS